MIYLDNAATSFPKPAGMAAAMSEHMASWCGNPGRSGHRFASKTAEAVYETRKVLAELIGTEKAHRIMFTCNATAALNQAIHGTAGAGEHVIMTAMEHNSVLRPVIASGAEYTIVPCRKDGSLEVEKVEKAIRKNTKLLICTAASNVTGTIMPIEKLSEVCRKHRIFFLVDASQAMGHLTVSAAGVDLLAAPGHKGLMGPMGTGFLYAGENVRLAPMMQGGTGTRSKELSPPAEFPESFEAGTVNAPGIVGLGYSLRWLKGQGVQEIAEHERNLIRCFDESLRNMAGVTVYGPENHIEKAGITAFNIDGADCEMVASQLNDQFGIAVRAGFHCAGLAHKTIGTWDTGAVRVSVGCFTTMGQIRRAADAVYRITKAVNGARPSQYWPARLHGCSWK